MSPLEKHCMGIPSERKALEWLHSICQDNEWLTLQSSESFDEGNNSTIIDVDLTVRSISNRVYCVAMGIEVFDGRFREMFDPTIIGKMDLEDVPNEEFSWHDYDKQWCKICRDIGHQEKRDLPICDQMVTLALCLRDDASTAKQIPLLDLFLAHDEREYLWISGYFLSGPETGVYGEKEQRHIPLEIRALCHVFACLNDELEVITLDGYADINQRMRVEAEKIRRKKRTLSQA